MQQVEVKGNAYDPRRDDTASKIVVGSEEILKYGDTTVTDVLKRLPGITVTGAAGRAGGEIRMRGLGSGYTQILLNGERAPAGFSLDSLAPELIERIEILHAASAEYSTQSIAGTINVVLKKTVKTAQRELKLGAGGGRDAFSRNGSLQWSDKDGMLSYSLAASVYRYDYDYGGVHDSPALDLGYLPDGRQNLLRLISGDGRGRSEGLNLAPRLNWNTAGGDSLTAQFFLNAGRSNSHSNYQTQTVLGARPDYDGNGSASGNHQAFGRADLSWVHKLDGGAKLELGLRSMLTDNSADTTTQGQIDGLGLVLERTVRVEAMYRTLSSSGKYSSPWMPGHALAMGWDGTVSRREEQRRQRERDLPGGSVPVASDDNFDADVKLLAAYAQDEWDITPRWAMYAGLRWEGIATRTSGNLFDVVDQRSSVWSPLLQTLWKLPDTQVATSCAWRSRAPTRRHRPRTWCRAAACRPTTASSSPTARATRSSSLNWRWASTFRMTITGPKAPCSARVPRRAASTATRARACCCRAGAGCRCPSTTAAPTRRPWSWKRSFPCWRCGVPRRRRSMCAPVSAATGRKWRTCPGRTTGSTSKSRSAATSASTTSRRAAC